MAQGRYKRTPSNQLPLLPQFTFDQPLQRFLIPTARLVAFNLHKTSSTNAVASVFSTQYTAPLSFAREGRARFHCTPDFGNGLSTPLNSPTPSTKAMDLQKQYVEAIVQCTFMQLPDKIKEFIRKEGFGSKNIVIPDHTIRTPIYCHLFLSFVSIALLHL
jgi:hypothetical protein